MFKLTDPRLVRRISDFLDGCGFDVATRTIIGPDQTAFFPPFGKLHQRLTTASRFHRFLFTVFRQGHVANERAARTFLSDSVFDAMVETGLLVFDQWGDVRTPSLALVPFQGLNLAVSLPPSYATATERTHLVEIPAETLSAVTELPASLAGRDVLDACAGTGVLGLLCAARGARRVVALEASEPALSICRFNALLNGLQQTVEVRESSLYSALPPDERFDFLVAVPPTRAMVKEARVPAAVAAGTDGAAVLRPLLEGLTAHLAPTFSGLVACTAVGDQYGIFIDQQLEKLALREAYRAVALVSHKISVVEYATTTLEPALRRFSGEVPQAERLDWIGRWLAEMKEKRAERVYTQLLKLSRPTDRPGVSYVPIYDSNETDPLVTLVRRHRAAA